MEEVSMDMPPGFRFHPTDEEIISHYLSEKVMNSSFISRAIGEVDLNKCEPWDLPKKAKMGEKEWYFFCQRDRKYPTGMRTNRATEAGYWKATGKDKEIYKGKGFLVGMKKTLVFYRGRAPKGEKTNWIMHEYRLDGKFSYHNIPRSAKDEWVVCRVFHKKTGIKKTPTTTDHLLRMNSFEDDMLDSSLLLPPLLDPPYFNMNRPTSSCFMDLEDDFKGITTAPQAMGTTSNSYFSTGMVQQQQLDHKNFLVPNNYPNYSVFYPQTPLSDPLFPYHGTSQSAYLHQEMNNNSFPSFPSSSGLKTQCKIEQFSSNHSIISLSQDTGLSTEVNTEISSVMSKHDMESNKSNYEDLEGHCSTEKVVDLECLWNY